MKRFVAILLIAAGLFLVMGAGGYALYSRALSRPGSAPLTDQLAGLSLVQQTQGSQAVGEINRLHGKEFPLTSAAVGLYGTQGSATLWVSGVPAGFMAERILSAMRERIAENRSPFTPTGERQDGKRILYELDGMGQKHFYFQSENLVIWLAVEPSLAEPVLEQALEFYP